MKNTVFVLFVLCFLVSPRVLAQQDVSKLEFQIKSTRLQVAEDVLVINSRIIRRGDRLIWRQKFRSKTQDQVFQIRSSEGSWDKKTQEGKIVLRLSSQGEPYRFVLLRTSKGVVARMFYNSKETGEQEKFVFQVDRIRYQSPNKAQAK